MTGGVSRADVAPATPAADRRLDVICLGRLAVDLYAQQLGARLEDVASFAKYLGGSSANIAFGAARLGLKSALLSRVGDEQMGRFLVQTLAREGCDVTHVRVDPVRLTGLVLLGLKDRDTFPLLFVRENCADMAVDPADFDEAFIAASRALLITGTHLSTAQVLKTSLVALGFARKNGVRTVLDIDYRPVLWGLTRKGDGATRFIASDGVTRHLQAVLPHFDLVIGTEEEFAIAGGSTDIIAALRAVRALTAAVLVVKRGPLGCTVFDAAIAASLDEGFTHRGVAVEVMNVLGAGDAFAAGFLRGWIPGEPWATCCAWATACGALVVSRHACAPAMPTPAELDYFLAHAQRLRRPGDDATLNRLHRVTAARVPWENLCVLAMDHRIQLLDLVREVAAESTADVGELVARLPRLKQLLVQAAAAVEISRELQGRVGVLLDDQYGTDALAAATGRGWWVSRPVELPLSRPVVFEAGRSVGTQLATWPLEHVVKCLVYFHPDDPVPLRLEQEAQLRSLYDACQASGHELLLEVIPPRGMAREDTTVLRVLTRLYNLGIQPDWWKLEAMTAAQWQALDALILARDPTCRGVVMLGLNQPQEVVAAGLRVAAASRTARGFAVGRTIFFAPARRWLAGASDDATLRAEVRANFEALVDVWNAARGLQPRQAA